MTTEKEKIQNEIDNYTSTLRGMIIFMNFYRFDDATRKMKLDTKLMQGWKYTNNLIREGQPGHEVTPDFSVLDDSGNAVIGEVKMSFAKNQDRWKDDLVQMKNYDADLTGWPECSVPITSHDIVLLLNPDFSRKIKNYYEKNISEIGDFKKPFVIVEYNEEEKRKRFYRFRIEYGALSNPVINSRLQDGVPVPQEAFIQEYAEVKLWDSMPPVPHLIALIWQHVVFDKAFVHEKFQKLRKGSKIDLTLTVKEIVDVLEKFFTFKKFWNGEDHRLPQIPKRSWVVTACDALVKMKEARWLDKQNTIEISFRKYPDYQAYFIDKYLQVMPDEKQEELFGPSEETETQKLSS